MNKMAKINKISTFHYGYHSNCCSTDTLPSYLLHHVLGIQNSTIQSLSNRFENLTDLGAKKGPNYTVLRKIYIGK